MRCESGCKHHAQSQPACRHPLWRLEGRPSPHPTSPTPLPLGSGGSSVAIRATQLPAPRLLTHHRRLSGSRVHVATAVTYPAGSSGQALTFTAGLKSGAAWLTNVYPGAIVVNVKTGPSYTPPPRLHMPPLPLSPRLCITGHHGHEGLKLSFCSSANV